MIDPDPTVTPERVLTALHDLAAECARLEEHGYRVDRWRIRPDVVEALATLPTRPAGVVPSSFMTYPLEVTADLPSATWASVEWRNR